MEKIASGLYSHLTPAQRERLETYRASLEKTADMKHHLATGLALAKAFLIPIAAGHAGAFLYEKAQERREELNQAALQNKIKTNKLTMSQESPFKEHKQKFHAMFDEVADLAPHVAAHPTMMQKIMAKYGPHNPEANLELMELEALKSLDHKLQDLTQRQARISGAKSKGESRGEQLGHGFMAGMAFAPPPPPDMPMDKISSVDQAEALVRLMHKRIELIKTASGGDPASFMKYMKMFAPGIALAGIPAVGVGIMKHKEQKALKNDLAKSLKVVSKNEDLLRAMDAEAIQETFHAIANFAPSVARNPVAARAAILSMQGAEGMNPLNIRALVDIERSGNDSKKNSLRDYVLPLATLGGTALTAASTFHKARKDSTEARKYELAK